MTDSPARPIRASGRIGRAGVRVGKAGEEYSHDAVAAARALGEPLQATQRGAQLASRGLEVPGAARPCPLP